ncbi:hypothetical protein JD844_019372 [Phrynosoma platyrhinos]|uniref:Bactericidal permeability-increasing protein n=1 Tax=Phrynosoma platyrhinos TaxID=52577 RepID=A0ABQ7SPU5_PHRPL|nr:hypothetical protein JD844_019372 [Phrynosoma platyrhinos]
MKGLLVMAIRLYICEEVSSTVGSRLEPFLQTLPVLPPGHPLTLFSSFPPFLLVTAKIDKISGIDYSLVEPPGEFFSMAHRSPPPFPPPALDFPVDHDRMVYFGLSTYLFNTAGDIPKEFKIRLNTTSFGVFIPQVEKLYPNMLMILKVSPSSAPLLTITPEILSLSPMVDVQAFAVLPNSTLAPLFWIGASTSISAKVAINATKIFGSLKLGRLQLSLKHSDVQLMQTLMNYYAASVLLPQINARLAEGFPLPLPDHLQVSNPVLQPHKVGDISGVPLPTKLQLIREIPIRTSYSLEQMFSIASVKEEED